MPFCVNCGTEVKETWNVCPNCSHEVILSSKKSKITDSVVMGDVVVIDNDSEAISQGFKKAIIEVEADKKKKEKEELDRQRLMRKTREKELRASEKQLFEKQIVAGKERKIIALKKNDIMITKYNSQKIQSLRERLNSKPFGTDQRQLVRKLRPFYLRHKYFSNSTLFRMLKTYLPKNTRSDYPSVQLVEYFYTVGELRTEISDKFRSLKHVWQHIGWVPTEDYHYCPTYRKKGKKDTEWTQYGILPLTHFRNLTVDVLPDDNQIELQALFEEAKALDETHSVSEHSLKTYLLLLFAVAFWFLVVFLVQADI